MIPLLKDRWSNRSREARGGDDACDGGQFVIGSKRVPVLPQPTMDYIDECKVESKSSLQHGTIT